MDPIKLHKKTIKAHRKAVRKLCWKMGLFYQGLVHDLSKYSKEEMSIAKYATGKRSPHDEARDKLGYSPSWSHHARKNPHHWEYWLDIGPVTDGYLKAYPLKMPYKYVIEMFCDMVGASKTYNKDNWDQTMPYNYWIKRRKSEVLMHKDSEYLLEKLFWNLHQLGEDTFIENYKKQKSYLKHAYESGTLLHESIIGEY